MCLCGNSHKRPAKCRFSRKTRPSTFCCSSAAQVFRDESQSSVLASHRPLPNCSAFRQPSNLDTHGNEELEEISRATSKHLAHQLLLRSGAGLVECSPNVVAHCLHETSAETGAGVGGVLESQQPAGCEIAVISPS